MQMNTFKTLYRYELKKITGRKIFSIMFFSCLLITVFVIAMHLSGKYYVDGEIVDTHYNMFLTDRAYERALSGRAINQTLLKETMDAYRKIPDPTGRYTLTEEYQTYARPYSAIYQQIRLFLDLDLEDVLLWEVDENAFYQARLAYVENHWQKNFLTEAEKNFWRQKETEVQTPFVYDYHQGYIMFLISFNVLGILIPLFLAVCLSGVFADEHTRRTDQLILSGAKGKTTLYQAKIAAGATVSLAVTILLLIAAAVTALSLYGTDGFHMQFQADLYPFSYPMSIGQACLIMCAMALFAAALTAILVMILSELLHSGIASMAVTISLVLATMTINIPPQFRFFSQLWDWLPVSFLDRWYVFDVRTITVFGHCLVSWQIVPPLYLVCAAGIALLGRRVYQRYQVSGR